MARAALRGVRKIQRRIEYKNHDVTLNSQMTGNNAWEAVHLSGITQGDNNNNRDGLKVTGTSLMMRARMVSHASSTLVDMIRVIILRDKSARGAVMSMDSGDQSVLIGTTFEALQNPVTRKRFQILMDRQFLLDRDTDTSYRHQKSFVKRFRFGSTITFEGTGGAIADGDLNQLYIVYKVDSATNMPSIVMFSRLNFHD